jgi:hypothetical protein
MRFPCYERAERRLIDTVFWATVKADPLLSKIQFTRSEHVGPNRVIAGGEPYDTHPEMHEASLMMRTEAFEKMDCSAFVAALTKGAQEASGSAKAMMFRHIGAVSDQVGNSVDGSGKTVVEGLKEFFMRVEIDFDDDGTPRFPTLIGPPGSEAVVRQALAALEADRDLAQRIGMLRATFVQSRPKRRLLSPC